MVSNKNNNKLHSCVNCAYFYFRSGDISQPYPEFACTKLHFDGIASKEEYDDLFKINECKDFNLDFKI